MNPRLTLLLVVLSVMPCAPVYAGPGAAEPQFRYYSAADGITQSNVYAIGQDKAGYMWFTTARGLNRFDGKDFVSVTIADGLPSNNLTAINIGSDNSVWVGDTRGGVSVLRGSRVAHTISPISNDITPIADIAFVDGRVLVIARGEGILEVALENGDYRFKRIIEHATAESLTVSSAGIWVQTPIGLHKLILGSIPELVLLSSELRVAHAAKDGEVWLVDNQNRIGNWVGGEFRARAVVPGDDPVLRVASATDGAVWLATTDRLYGLDSSQSSNSDGLVDVRQYDQIDKLSSLFVDRENTLWLSNSSRLMRFLGDRFRHYRLRTGADAQTIWAISEDSRGRHWFGTESDIVIRSGDESLTVVGKESGLPKGAVRDIVFGGEGRMWAGVREHGLYKVSTRDLQATAVAGTEGLEVLDIAVTASGTVWFTTLASGIYQYAPATGGLRNFPVPSGTSVYTLDTLDDQNIWYGADEVGLVHLVLGDDGNYAQQVYGRAEGLRSAYFDQVKIVGDDEIWICMEEGGIYRFGGDVFIDLGASTPLADQTVYLIEALSNGTFVVGGEQGLYQFEPGSDYMAHYSQLSGFVGTETNVHAVFLDSTSHLWIGTVDGATSMDAMLPMERLVEVEPYIVSVVTEKNHERINDRQEIAPQFNSIQVEFAAVSLRHPRGIEYSYKLTGADHRWGEPTTSNSVRYSSLAPGSYEFKVRSRYPGGAWSDNFASKSFTVLPHFWQESWFILLAVIAVLLVMRAIMMYRTRHMNMLNETLRQQVAERTQSIQMAHQHLLTTNEQLSLEIAERKKADSARDEIETRFKGAFENAPIGMGLLDTDGQLFDVNPALTQLFWPGEPATSLRPFQGVIHDEDREKFCAAYQKLVANEEDTIEESLNCVAANGDILKVVVHISAAKSKTGAFMYSVLQLQDVTESIRLTKQLKHQASYDELTGLLNRRSFESLLQSASEKSESEGVTSYLMYMDLDQFKVVNDTSGHAAGDQLLRSVSEILLKNVRANDSVCRLGGDEFGIVLWNCPTEVAARIAESIRSDIADLRFQWDSESYRIGVSIGGLPIDPTVGDCSEIQQLADAACYAAKEAGRNRVHMVSGGKDSARDHRGQVRWVQRLRDAMDNCRFAIYGQAIMSLDSNSQEPESIEILLRLRDVATRRLIPPGAFMPAAERYGLSVELDEWVVKHLLNTLYVYHSFNADDRKYWINLSGTSIGDSRFAAFLVDAIKKFPLPAGTINFEITESAVIRNVVEAGRLMNELRAMGCQFALDDFGTKLSSFDYLKNLPVDLLKIDGTFIRDIVEDETHRIFVKSVIDIAHTLNIKTTAELIETDEMLSVVKELGADYAQGYAIGRPYALTPKLALSSEPELTPVTLQQIAN